MTDGPRAARANFAMARIARQEYDRDVSGRCVYVARGIGAIFAMSIMRLRSRARRHYEAAARGIENCMSLRDGNAMPLW